MKFTDFVLERSVWASTLGKRGQLTHVVARDLIKLSAANDAANYENLLKIVRRYE